MVVLSGLSPPNFENEEVLLCATCVRGEGGRKDGGGGVAEFLGLYGFGLFGGVFGVVVSLCVPFKAVEFKDPVESTDLLLSSSTT